MKSKTVVIFLVSMLLTLLLGGGGTYWWLQQQGGAALSSPLREPVAAVAAEPATPKRYLTLDKIIVMLREARQDELHYMSIDLVFRTDNEQQAQVKEQLPLLKSIAVRALSQLTRTQAAAMSVDEFQALLLQHYSQAYRKDQQPQPFSDVLVSKLIVE
ncbi:flagellar basal body-associated FliL family protein [Vogesella indigofera]|uniref:flagellar basal body-associated FliL family protein n=1 Tax=Vogesella indigofera TaxID=45465 RepID=UPI00234E53D6|nr:flagellar basal body-associated FliL family protein [Vogesella indigofera]MDC7700682.1 flagellar basal body-associated FliL family protein [Vogesella indigofera]